MKIKTDFVTNSSSTSFIVFWPIKIETIEDIKKYLTYESNRVIQKIFDCSVQQTYIVVSEENIEHIQKVLKYSGYEPIDYEECLKQFCERNDICQHEYYKLPNISKELFWKEHNIKNEIESSKKVKEIIDRHKGLYIYTYSFDDSDEYLQYEFKWPFQHMRINNH